MADCKSIKYDLDQLIKKKRRYEDAVSDTTYRIVDQTIKLNTCQTEQRNNTARNNNTWVAQEDPGNGGKRRHTKRYKKSKKSKRRFTRSKIRV